MLAFKAFMKALRQPKEAETFLKDSQPVLPLKKEDTADKNHLRLLSFLQRDGRLLDFFQEDISGFDDAQVGAAAREVHRACKESLDELISVAPVTDDREGAEVRLPKGYDATKYKVVGKVVGDPPYVGILVHRGWQARKHQLPKSTSTEGIEILCPAEIELR
jgi:hypothetical protein